MADTLDPALPREVQERANRVLELACDKERYLATAESSLDHREEHFGAVGRDGVRIASLEVALEMLEAALER